MRHGHGLLTVMVNAVDEIRAAVIRDSEPPAGLAPAPGIVRFRNPAVLCLYHPGPKPYGNVGAKCVS